MSFPAQAPFVSVDVVGSTAIKTGQEMKQDIIYTFLAYHKLVSDSRLYPIMAKSQNITGDGIMCRFQRPERCGLARARNSSNSWPPSTGKQNHLTQPMAPAGWRAHGLKCLKARPWRPDKLSPKTIDIAAKAAGRALTPTTHGFSRSGR